jgi:hypothetical protein
MNLIRNVVLALACGLLSTSAGAQTIEDLKRELGAKNALINKLEQRLNKLEKKDQSGAFLSERTIGDKPATFSTRKAEPATKSFSEPNAVLATPRTPVTAASPDDDEFDQALERTLVREGALVLPPWTSELTPQFSYAHWDKVQDPFLRNSYSAAMTLRMGLPWTSQILATVPYAYDQFRDGSSASGIGDAGFLLSKELSGESDWIPNLVGSMGWTSPTRLGNTFTPIPYVSGFQAGLTASKRLDPLVVFGSVSYFSSAARDIAGTRFDPADVIGARIGGSLAISPATSITAGFNLAYLTNTQPTDFVVVGSDRVLSSVDIGLSTILWRRTLLNVTAQFGVTGHVPDFRLIASIPVRF